MILNKACHWIPWVSTLKNMGYVFLKIYILWVKNGRSASQHFIILLTFLECVCMHICAHPYYNTYISMNYLKSDYHIMNNFIDISMFWVCLISLTPVACGGQKSLLLEWSGETCACHLIFCLLQTLELLL